MGGSQEELPHVRGQGRSGAAAEWSYPVSEVRGLGPEDLPHTRGQGPQPGGATPHLSPGQEDQPHVQGAVAARVQEGLEELSHVEGKEGRW